MSRAARGSEGMVAFVLAACLAGCGSSSGAAGDPAPGASEEAARSATSPDVAGTAGGSAGEAASVAGATSAMREAAAGASHSGVATSAGEAASVAGATSGSAMREAAAGGSHSGVAPSGSAMREAAADGSHSGVAPSGSAMREAAVGEADVSEVATSAGGAGMMRPSAVGAGDGETRSGAAAHAGAASGSPRPPLAVGPLRSELPAKLPEPLRWLAIGGGATPEFNQVSIEQDLLLAQEVFGTGGALLFAGGPGSHGVQVADAEPRGDPLLAALAELFAPRGGRAASYRPTQSSPIAAATRDNAIAAVEQAVGRPGPLLRLYLAGHGERGEPPDAGGLGLWGQTSLRVAELAEVLDEAARPVQVVATSCFSGAFGDLVFARGEQAAGPAPTIRCGLFAATAEREASGCDPNPDRAAQEGYALHFLNALRGRDRGGRPLPPAQLDLDGDGAISPLEAHARARIAGQGIDVPTTTSERWLHATAPTRGRSRAPALPEEDAVIAALSAALGLGREGDVAAALEQAFEATAAAHARLDAASGREDEAYRRAAAELLARFPVLDDPWHPDFAPTLARHRAEIEAHLAASPAYAAFRAAGEEAAAVQAEVAELLARSARLERLLRALRVRALAGRLKGRGGPAWARYEALLACERGQI